MFDRNSSHQKSHRVLCLQNALLAAIGPKETGIQVLFGVSDVTGVLSGLFLFYLGNNP